MGHKSIIWINPRLEGTDLTQETYMLANIYTFAVIMIETAYKLIMFSESIYLINLTFRQH